MSVTLEAVPEKSSPCLPPMKAESAVCNASTERSAFMGAGEQGLIGSSAATVGHHSRMALNLQDRQSAFGQLQALYMLPAHRLSSFARRMHETDCRR